MAQSYKILLLLGMIAIPLLIISLRNRFDRPVGTAVRFTAAIVSVWGYLIIIRMLVVHIDLRLASTPEEIQLVHAGSGAKNAFAFLFGWVPGLALAFVSWVLARAWHWYRHQRDGNRRN